MSNTALRKASPRNDVKTTPLGTALRQQGFHEVNKRRTFLQDSSWIKKRPEEEKSKNERDEKKVTITRYGSDDTLDRISDRNDAAKTYKANILDNRLTNRGLSTFRTSEATKPLPGVSLNTSTATGPTATTTPVITPVKKKRQSWFPPPHPGYNATRNAAGSRREPSALPPTLPRPYSPVPSPPQARQDNRNQGLDDIIRVDTSRHDKGSQDLDNLIKMNRNMNKNQGLDGIFRTNHKAERIDKKNQELDSLIKVNPQIEKNDKGNEKLDNMIKVKTRIEENDKGNQNLDKLINVTSHKDKDDKGNQGLDSLIKVNHTADRSGKKNQDFDSIIKVNANADKNGKGDQALDNLIKVKPNQNENITGKQDLDSVIKVNTERNKNTQRGQELDSYIKENPSADRNIPGGSNLDNLIKVNPATHSHSQGAQNLDNLIKVNPGTGKGDQGNQDLDNLIKVNQPANKPTPGGEGLDEFISVNPNAIKNITGHQDLDNFITVNPETLRNNQRNQDDLDKFIKVTPEVLRSNQRSQDLDRFIKVDPTTFRHSKRDQDLDNHIEVKSNGYNKKTEGGLDSRIDVNPHIYNNAKRLEEYTNESTNARNNQSSINTAYSHETRTSPSFNTRTRYSSPKDSVVYTRTYVENSKYPKDGYEESISGKYIQTVYSTSDRSVIEKDMCTYCRKPLGSNTKMILDELQICCHSTCFKCEICKKPLENLEAGDSIWIYKHTVHCEPCYSKVVAKWIL
ncbi:sciellin isoform 4-T5 [Sarcophilus harrisii]